MGSSVPFDRLNGPFVLFRYNNAVILIAEATVLWFISESQPEKPPFLSHFPVVDCKPFRHAFMTETVLFEEKTETSEDNAI